MTMPASDKLWDRRWVLCLYLLAPAMAAAGLVAVVFGLNGAGAAGTQLALTVTARFSFMLFWLAYSGSALAALFGAAFAKLKRHGRELGLAFASAQLIHLGLVVWLCYLGRVPSSGTFLRFGVAVFWLYLIAAFSIANLWPKLHPGVRRAIFFIGLNYIAYAFAVDFLRHPLQGGLGHVSYYLPFAVMSVAGPVLRLAAFVLRHRLKPAGSAVARVEAGTAMASGHVK